MKTKIILFSLIAIFVGMLFATPTSAGTTYSVTIKVQRVFLAEDADPGKGELYVNIDGTRHNLGSYSDDIDCRLTSETLMQNGKYSVYQDCDGRNINTSDKSKTITKNLNTNFYVELKEDDYWTSDETLAKLRITVKGAGTYVYDTSASHNGGNSAFYVSWETGWGKSYSAHYIADQPYDMFSASSSVGASVAVGPIPPLVTGFAYDGLYITLTSTAVTSGGGGGGCCYI